MCSLQALLLTSHLPPPLVPQAVQFTQARREELLDLQRTLLGMEDIAVKEGLKPSEAEIEVGGGRRFGEEAVWQLGGLAVVRVG